MQKKKKIDMYVVNDFRSKDTYMIVYINTPKIHICSTDTPWFYVIRYTLYIFIEAENEAQMQTKIDLHFYFRP